MRAAATATAGQQAPSSPLLSFAHIGGDQAVVVLLAPSLPRALAFSAKTPV